MIVTSDVLDSSMQRLAEGAHALVVSFLAAHGSRPHDTASPAVVEEAASPMKLSQQLSSPDSDRREQIRRRQVAFPSSLLQLRSLGPFLHSCGW